MKDMNRISVIGRVGKDPETHEFSSGDLKVSFSIATSDRWKDDQGNQKERTQWHNVAIVNQGLAKIALDYVKKGSRVMVEGAMEYREWTDDQGVKRNASEIALRPFGEGRLVLLDQKKEQSQQSGNERTSQPRPR